MVVVASVSVISAGTVTTCVVVGSSVELKEQADASQPNARSAQQTGEIGRISQTLSGVRLLLAIRRARR